MRIERIDKALENRPGARPASRHGGQSLPVPAAPSPTVQLGRYLTTQGINASAQERAIRHITPADFADSPYLPRTAHFRAVNALLSRSARGTGTAIATLSRLETRIGQDKGKVKTDALLRHAKLKDLVQSRQSRTERIWSFYRDLFEQRTGPFGRELGAVDRIALDCYQACYMGLGQARSIPTPPPLTYIEGTGGPATYRRGVRVSRIAREANPFPLVKLPYSRLIAPWSLGAVPHEIGHNLQNDLRLWAEGPRLIGAELRRRGLPEAAVRIWMRWHKEIYADLIGVLLIGPAQIASIMDVVGKAPAKARAFRDGAVHPVPILRPRISTILLRRIGFAADAEAFDRTWQKIYPASLEQSLPTALRSTFPAAAAGTVEALCFSKNAAYGDRRLVDVVRFLPRDAATVAEAAERLADGTNPGILPERFLIAAARVALDRKLAAPRVIATNFYSVLLGR